MPSESKSNFAQMLENAKGDATRNGKRMFFMIVKYLPGGKREYHWTYEKRNLARNMQWSGVYEFQGNERGWQRIRREP